jgi:uncharacterized membrane protein YwzB
MKIAKKGFLNFVIILILLVCATQFVLFNAIETKAADLMDQQEGFGVGGAIPTKFGASDTPADIRVIVANIIKAFLGLLGIIFVVLLIAAGYKWMTAAGNEENIKEAAGQIKMAVIGIAIIITAYAVTQFILAEIYGAVNSPY